MSDLIRPLGEYLSLLEQEGLLAGPVPDGLDRSAPVALVSCDSRNVVPGTLFLCKGSHFREEFLEAARERGAFLYAGEALYPDCPLPGLRLTDLRRAMALLADLCYGHPSGRLNVVGFTGTKGKSTSAYYLKSVLDAWRASLGEGETGVISSIDTYDGVERFESHLTTPEPLDLQRHLAHAADAGLEYLTMEVSSQALKYHRTLCTRFAAACFLNIGYDHVSPVEHPDFEDYFASKLKLFAQSEVNCVNLDSDHADRILEAARQAGKPVFTFSQRDPQADVYASQVRKEDGQTVFHVRTPQYERELRLTMPGLFNVENALGVIAVCHALHVPPSAVYDGLVRARVPGRMETYANADGSLHAIVDYAHNRLSFETLFRSVRAEYPGREMAIVFGCPGKKAYDRRRDLGEAAGRWCDRVYLTEEDSGEEDTLDICREIAPNVEKEGCPVRIIPNRGEAIRQAVLDCAGPTVLLLTGKGRETRQKRGTAYIDTPTDVEYAQAFLQEYDLRRGLERESPARALLSILPALEARREELWVVCCPPGGEEAAARDAAALSRAGVRMVLVRRGSGPLPAALSGNGVTLSAGDGGLLYRADTGFTVRPKVLDTLLDGGFLPVLEGGEEESLAVAQATRAHRLVLFTATEPSLALGVDRQVELLHLDLTRAAELRKAGELPLDTDRALELACRAVEGGVRRAVLLAPGADHILLLDALGQHIQGISVTP